jgi:hypothetical protein
MQNNKTRLFKSVAISFFNLRVPLVVLGPAELPLQLLIAVSERAATLTLAAALLEELTERCLTFPPNLLSTCNSSIHGALTVATAAAAAAAAVTAAAA